MSSAPRLPFKVWVLRVGLFPTEYLKVAVATSQILEICEKSATIEKVTM